MCILFFHAKKLNVPGKFRIIIISNRDEFYKRPAAPAHFWKENPMVFGGRDLQEGDEGGTWLAVNKQGKIASLLNIASNVREVTARSRGHLVTDFVASSIPAPQYQALVAEEAIQHNPFHLITFEILPTDVRVLYVARQPVGDVLGPEDISPAPNSHLTDCLSNSPLKIPFRKAKEGVDLFNKIISDYDSMDCKEALIESLMKFAKTETKFFPDPVQTEYRENSPLTEKFSSIFVHIPEHDYGTRTHTVILVDDVGTMEVVESTRSSENLSEWMLTKTTFKIGDS